MIFLKNLKFKLQDSALSAVLVALCALEPRSTDSLGTQHCANFESHSNRVTFETSAIMVIVKVHPQYKLANKHSQANKHCPK